MEGYHIDSVLAVQAIPKEEAYEPYERFKQVIEWRYSRIGIDENDDYRP